MAAAVSNGVIVQNSEANESVLQESIMLAPPNTDGGINLDKALKERRSIRTLNNDSLTLAAVSQLLWAAQGK